MCCLALWVLATERFDHISSKCEQGLGCSLKSEHQCVQTLIDFPTVHVVVFVFMLIRAHAGQISANDFVCSFL